MIARISSTQALAPCLGFCLPTRRGKQRKLHNAETSLHEKRDLRRGLNIVRDGSEDGPFH